MGSRYGKLKLTPKIPLNKWRRLVTSTARSLDFYMFYRPKTDLLTPAELLTEVMIQPQWSTGLSTWNDIWSATVEVDAFSFLPIFPFFLSVLIRKFCMTFKLNQNVEKKIWFQGKWWPKIIVLTEFQELNSLKMWIITSRWTTSSKKIIQ